MCWNLEDRMNEVTERIGFALWNSPRQSIFEQHSSSGLRLLHRCVLTACSWKMIWYFVLCVTALGTALFLLGSLVRYQISPVRLLLYQPRCPPAKQMTAAPRHPPSLLPPWQMTRQLVSYPSPVHLILLCQEGRLPRGCPSTSCRDRGQSRSSLMQLHKLCCYFRTKTMIRHTANYLL